MQLFCLQGKMFDAVITILIVFDNFQNNGLIPMIRECNEIDTCTNGEPPFVPPGQCCPICGKILKVAAPLKHVS